MRIMAAAAGGSGAPSKGDEAFSKFMTEVKTIEKRDSVLTSAQQIDRLLRPGSKYSNLNPYDVLMIDPDTPEDQIRKAYRKLSFLVHPDKNHDDRDRAQQAFDAVNKAYKMFDDPEQMELLQGAVEEAKGLTEQKVKEKRKVAAKQGNTTIEEDNPEKVMASLIAELENKYSLTIQDYKQLLHNTLTKVIADLEIKKKQMEEREHNERKRQREMEEEVEAKAKREKEWKKEWEESRTERVDSWRDFQQKGSKKKKKKTVGVGGLKPPKLKQEKR